MVSTELETRQTECLMRLRQGILIILAAIEDYAGIERTKEPNHKLRERLIQN